MIDWSESYAKAGASELSFALLESALEAFVWFDRQGTRAWANAEARRLEKETRIEGWPFVSDTEALRLVAQVQESRDPARLSTDRLELRVVPFQGGVGVYYQDRGEVRRLEGALQVEAERAAFARRVGRLIAFEWDLATDWIEATEEAEALFGFRCGPVSRLRELVHPEDRALIVRPATLDDDEIVDAEYRILSPYGWRTLLRRARVERDETGEPRRVVGVWTDLTEHAAHHEATRRSEERYRALVRASSELVWTTNADGLFVDPQPGWQALTGQSWEDCRGIGGYDAIHPEDAASARAAWSEAISTKRTFRHEMRIFSQPHEAYRRMVTQAVPVFGAGGEVLEWVGTLSDVEEQRETAARLDENQGKLHLALHAAGAGVWVFDPATQSGTWSTECYELYGDDPSLGPPTFDRWLVRIVAEDRARFLHAVEHAVEARSGFEIEYRIAHPEKGERWLVSSGRVLPEEPIRLSGISYDVTERKRHEQELRESEERFRRLADIAPVKIWMTDPDGVCTYFNRRMAEFAGRPVEELIGTAVPPGIHPDDIERGGEVFSKASAERAAFEIEIRLRRADGEYRLIRSHGVPRFGAERDFLGYIGVMLDITESRRAQAELRALNADLEDRVATRTAELEAAVRELEGFTYSVSHDLRAPLRAIVATSRMLEEEFSSTLGEDGVSHLRRQAAAANRLGLLIDELLKLSRLSRSDMVRQPFDLSALASEVAAEITGQNRYSATFEIQSGIHAEGDPRLVRFVLLNLLENAAKFSPFGTPVEFGSDGRTFYVRDRGIGFDMAYASKLFQPFERLVTDAEFPGTGIGLANVQRIVQRHGGRVWAESVPGQGATFYFTLG